VSFCIGFAIPPGGAVGVPCCAVGAVAVVVFFTLYCVILGGCAVAVCCFFTLCLVIFGGLLAVVWWFFTLGVVNTGWGVLFWSF